MVSRDRVGRPPEHPRQSILLGVTADTSLKLMDGFPELLNARGWDVHVVSSPGPGLDSLGRSGTIQTHAIPMRRDPSPIADLIGLLHWVRQIRSIRPDVMSVGTPKAGLLGGLAGLACRVPHRVYLLRGLRLETEHGWRRRVLALTERISMAASHVVLAVSPSLKDQVRALRLCRLAKVVVLGSGSSNGVDLNRFDPARAPETLAGELRQRFNLENGTPVIGFVGRVTSDKGLADLARARQILDDRGIDHHLLIVGAAENHDGRTVLAELNEAGRPAISVGFQTDLPAYFSLIDILCLPTHREGFPNVVLEAAASGIPTVTTDATGAVDSVIDGVTGLLSPVGDGNKLANNLQMLIVDPALRARLGSAAHDRARDQFDRRKVQGLHEDFYVALAGVDPKR